MNTLPVMQSLTMSSREIAELTGKQHKNVLRDIDNAIESTGSKLSRSIKSTTYIDAKGETRRQYALDFRATMRELGKQIGGLGENFGSKSFYGILAVVGAPELLITQTLNQGIYRGYS